MMVPLSYQRLGLLLFLFFFFVFLLFFFVLFLCDWL